MKNFKEEKINHINYPDKQGRVYCRRTNKLYKIDPKICLECPMYSGSIQGAGVECTYNDFATKNDDLGVVAVTNPKDQLLYISKLIDSKKLPKAE